MLDKLPEDILNIIFKYNINKNYFSYYSSITINKFIHKTFYQLCKHILIKNIYQYYNIKNLKVNFKKYILRNYKVNYIKRYNYDPPYDSIVTIICHKVTAVPTDKLTFKTYYCIYKNKKIEYIY